MKKTLAALFLTGVFLTACGGSSSKPVINQTTPSGEIKTTTASDKAKYEAFEDKTTKLFDEAKVSLDISKCKQIEIEGDMKNCESIVSTEIMRIAAERKDKSICSKLNDGNKKDECVKNLSK